MNVCVIGTGYVGLVTGALLAEIGHRVWGVDKDAQKIECLNSGRIPIYEPGLPELITDNVGAGRLTFSTDLADGVRNAEMVFIAVGTPANGDGSSDLSAVKEVARGIARAMDGYKVIVMKSTVPVGTCEMVKGILREELPTGMSFGVASNPEFLREGSAVYDARFSDRIVIGADDQRVAARLVELYATLGRPLVMTDVASAEMIKYASNAFLATKISFINAIGDVCEAVGADVTQVARGMALDSRIGQGFLQAGLGFGGSCFPKDTVSLISTAARVGVDLSLLQSVVEVNRRRVARLLESLRKLLSPLDTRLIAVLGLAFKPNTDDIRYAKSVELIQGLDASGARVQAYDPVAADRARQILPERVRICPSAYEAAAGAEALVLATEWNEFGALDFARVRAAMARPLVVDGRNFYDPARMRRLGFEYYGMGRAL